MKYAKIVLRVVGPLLLLLVVGVAMLYFLVPAFEFRLVWGFYRGYAETLANLTGINHYLITALSLAAFVPFYYGVTLLLYHPFDRRKRWLGVGILLLLGIGYNVSLYAATRHTTFAFSGGQSHRYYAITPSGVHFFDRAGVDPTYGIPLQPVTSENVRQLELLAKGEFVPANPTTVRFFNPNTGKAELWYYKTPEGAFEFYTQPGFHPGTGQALMPVTQEIYLEWKRSYDAAKKKEQDDLTKRRAEEDKHRRELEKKSASVVPGAYYGGRDGYLFHAGVIFAPPLRSRGQCHRDDPDC